MADSEPNSQRDKLDELTQAAALQYSLKNFAAAADHYADAVELQAELNGEMAPANAELLFYYGRALYKVAVAKSDVLGAKGANDDKKAQKAKKAEEAKSEPAKPESESSAPKPASAYFQLTGDENWDDSDDDDDEEAEQEDEDEDDFGNAYEVFELSRVLYQKQIDSDASKGKSTTPSPVARAIKEKIADCHGFLVEISLENERFHDAVSDARAALALQEELHPFDHENVTEAHYSLSLALEFASVSKIREDQRDTAPDETDATDADADKDGINWALRSESAKHTQLAIDSLTARLAKENAALSSPTTPLTAAQKSEKQTVIADKKALLDDLHARLKELKLDPSKQDYDALDPSVVQGLFGSLLGADKATQQAKLAEASKSANDVSQVVRKKAKPAPAPVVEKAAGSNKAEGKRKADTDADSKGEAAKKQRTET